MNKRRNKKAGLQVPNKKVRKMFPDAFAFVDALKKAGYPIKFEYMKKDHFSDRKFSHKSEPYCWFGNHIKGKVSYQIYARLPSDELHHPRMDNRIVIENQRCFNKWTQCPISLPIPKNKAQFAYVVGKLKEMSTEEAYNASNNFKYEKIYEYPKNIFFISDKQKAD